VGSCLTCSCSASTTPHSRLFNHRQGSIAAATGRPADNRHVLLCPVAVAALHRSMPRQLPLPVLDASSAGRWAPVCCAVGGQGRCPGCQALRVSLLRCGAGHVASRRGAQHSPEEGIPAAGRVLPCLRPARCGEAADHSCRKTQQSGCMRSAPMPFPAVGSSSMSMQLLADPRTSSVLTRGMLWGAVCLQVKAGVGATGTMMLLDTRSNRCHIARLGKSVPFATATKGTRRCLAAVSDSFSNPLLNPSTDCLSLAISVCYRCLQHCCSGGEGSAALQQQRQVRTCQHVHACRSATQLTTHQGHESMRCRTCLCCAGPNPAATLKQ
jgi:hypothetical protein